MPSACMEASVERSQLPQFQMHEKAPTKAKFTTEATRAHTTNNRIRASAHTSNSVCPNRGNKTLQVSFSTSFVIGLFSSHRVSNTCMTLSLQWVAHLWRDLKFRSYFPVKNAKIFLAQFFFFFCQQWSTSDLELSDTTSHPQTGWLKAFLSHIWRAEERVCTILPT